MKGSCMTWFAAALLSGSVPLAAQAGWKDLTGKVAPQISASTWLNTGGEAPDVETLKGKVWLLEFFATW